MWFKQLQLFQIELQPTFSIEDLNAKLELLAFKPCLPSMHQSIGWVKPIEEDEAAFSRKINEYIMISLKIEEKILPHSVIRHELLKKVQEIELSQHRKVRNKEKLSLKDEVTFSLLPKAFSRYTTVWGYLDINAGKLILNTTSQKRTESFISLLKKTLELSITPINTNRLSALITHWLKSKEYPTTFSIEKSCLLQDTKMQKRIIRCQHQDLFSLSIQALIKDGCEAKQLAMCWQDKVNFTLSENFSLRSIKFLNDFSEAIDSVEPETETEAFDANFFIMTQTFTEILSDLGALIFEFFNDECYAYHSKTVNLPNKSCA